MRFIKRIISNTNQVIKHIFYLLDEDMLFYSYALAKFTPAAVLNARVLLFFDTSEHRISPPLKARFR